MRNEEARTASGGCVVHWWCAGNGTPGLPLDCLHSPWSGRVRPPPGDQNVGEGGITDSVQEDGLEPIFLARQAAAERNIQTGTKRVHPS
jgi:hypothetical protein